MNIELGQLIDVNVSEKIKKHTNTNDIIQVSSRFENVSWYDLKNRVYRTHKVNSRTLPAVVELVKVAIKNASSATADVELLQSVIKNS